MVIGVDGNEANVKKKVGVSFYTLNLLKYFKKKANKNLRFIIFLRQSPLPDLPLANSYFTYKVIPGRFFWLQFFLPLALRFQKNIDVFFSPAHYTPYFSSIPLVVTIHDLSYLYYPQDFKKKDLYQLTNWTKSSLYKAKKIITVSQTSKKDLIKFYQIPQKKITVVYNGFEKKISARSGSVKELIVNKKEAKAVNYFKNNNYILYVGTLQPRKNLITLIRAFQSFKRLNREFKLVIVGKKGWLYKKIFEEVANLGLNKDVFFTDYVSDSYLAWLYKNAFCFVLPSFYEGFGIPLLEAMSFNCPVIASSSSSLPEIGGDACLYFNPASADDLFKKLTFLLKNDKLRKELIEKGKKRIKKFSWEKCGKETLEVIKKSYYENKNN